MSRREIVKSILIIIISIGFFLPAKAGNPDALKEGFATMLVFVGIESGLVAGGIYTTAKNIGYLNNRYTQQPSITAGYIFSISNITAGSVLFNEVLSGGKEVKQLGLIQITFGILCLGSTVMAHLESNKELPVIDPTEIPVEVKLTPESWYTYWGLGVSSISYPSGIQKEIDRFYTYGDGENRELSLDLLGFYIPLTSKTIAGIVVNTQNDRYGNEIVIRQRLYGASVIHYTGESFGSVLFVRADIGLSNMEQEIADGSNKEGDGFGLSGGSGWSFDLGGSRLLLNVNYSYRHMTGNSYNSFGFSVGGLF